MKRIVLSAIVVTTLGISGNLRASDAAPPTSVTVQTAAQLAALPAAQVIQLAGGGRTTAGALRTQRDDTMRTLGAKARAAEAAYNQALASTAKPTAALTTGVKLLDADAFKSFNPMAQSSGLLGSGAADWCAAWNVKASICWSELVSVWTPTTSFPGFGPQPGPQSPIPQTDFTFTQTGNNYETTYGAHPCVQTEPKPGFPSPCSAAKLHPGWVIDHVVSKVVEGSPTAATATGLSGGGIGIKFGGTSATPRTDAIIVWVYIKPATPIPTGTPLVK